jgi:hypothetical protein
MHCNCQRCRSFLLEDIAQSIVRASIGNLLFTELLTLIVRHSTELTGPTMLSQTTNVVSPDVFDVLREDSADEPTESSVSVVWNDSLILVLLDAVQVYGPKWATIRARMPEFRSFTCDQLRHKYRQIAL